MPPHICPRPGPRNPGPDCAFAEAAERIRFQRLLVEAQREARLRVAIQHEQSEVPSLADLIRSEAAQRQDRRPALPPGSPPTRPFSILDELKEERR